MEQNFATIVTEMNISKTLTLALTRYYQKTQLSAQISFLYSIEQQGIEMSLGFNPRSPNEEELNILINEIHDAEKLLLNEYIVNNSGHFENIKQLIFKYKEEMRQIIERQKND